jgi:hypothetical protein
MWSGEVYMNWKNKPHEPEWVSWHDFQAACTWFACKKCEEKFFVTDEELDKREDIELDTDWADFIKPLMDKQHTELIQRNIDAD